LERKGDWIETFTGKQFYVLDPRPEDICIEDIAHSLSQQCRYNGHCKAFYSVAQHCLDIVENMKYNNYSNKIQLYGLLHDSAEAYISDIPRPIKRSIDGFNEIEDKILDQIWVKFDILEPSEKEWEIVKIFDNAMLFYEGLYLTNNTNDWSWNYYNKSVINNVLFTDNKSNEETEKEFLEVFNKLIK